ncbi:hypothetical protein MHYP_G00295680 [Metynnis hypsauchen]
MESDSGQYLCAVQVHPNNNNTAKGNWKVIQRVTVSVHKDKRPQPTRTTVTQKTAEETTKNTTEKTTKETAGKVSGQTRFIYRATYKVELRCETTKWQISTESDNRIDLNCSQCDHIRIELTEDDEKLDFCTNKHSQSQPDCTLAVKSGFVACVKSLDPGFLFPFKPSPNVVRSYIVADPNKDTSKAKKQLLILMVLHMLWDVVRSETSIHEEFYQEDPDHEQSTTSVDLHAAARLNDRSGESKDTKHIHDKDYLLFLKG